MKAIGIIRNAAVTLLLALVPTALAWGQGITVAVDNTSTYVPTTIINGSFDDEPWMVYTYNDVTYYTCPDPTDIDTASSSLDNESGYAKNVVFNGVDGGWNTTDRTIWRSSLFEYTNSTSGLHNYQHNSSILQTDKYVEMNNYHSCMLYQDLTTYGHDVIRWTLKHAVTTAGDDYQPIRVEIGAPNRDGEGHIINASGWASDLNPQIDLGSKAIFSYNGVTDKDGNTSTQLVSDRLRIYSIYVCTILMLTIKVGGGRRKAFIPFRKGRRLRALDLSPRQRSRIRVTSWTPSHSPRLSAIFRLIS